MTDSNGNRTIFESMLSRIITPIVGALFLGALG